MKSAIYDDRDIDEFPLSPMERLHDAILSSKEGTMWHQSAEDHMVILRGYESTFLAHMPDHFNRDSSVRKLYMRGREMGIVDKQRCDALRKAGRTNDDSL